MDQPLLRQAAIQIQHLYCVPPYDRDDMEFKYGVWTGISSFHCENSRQLGEQNTLPGRLREVKETNFALCKFGGSRQGGQMNMTALRSMMLVWDDSLALVMAMRHLFIKNYISPSTSKERLDCKPLTMLEIYLLARLAICFPAFLIRRHKNPLASGNLGAPIAAQYQLMAGVFLIGQHMMGNAETLLHESTFMSAEEIYEYAEQNQILVSEQGGVCAGSKKNILKFLQCLIHGSKSHGSKEFQAVVTDRVFAGTDIDLKRFLDYYRNTVLLDLGLGRIVQKLNLNQHEYCTLLAQTGRGEVASRIKRVFLRQTNQSPNIGWKEKCQQSIRTTDLIFNRYLKGATLSFAAANESYNTSERHSVNCNPFSIQRLTHGCSKREQMLLQPCFAECTRALKYSQAMSTETQNNILAALQRRTGFSATYDDISNKFFVLCETQLNMQFGLKIKYGGVV